MEIEQKVREAVREHMGMNIEFFINSGRRLRDHVIVRQSLMYHLRQQGHTLKAIGKFFGRDHSTVIHAVETVETWKSLPKNYKYENVVYNKIFSKQTNLTPSKMSNVLTFYRTIISKGEAMYNMETQEFNPENGFFVQAIRPVVIPVSNFSLDKLFESDSIIVTNQEMLEDETIFLRGRVIGKSVELSLVQEFPTMKDAESEALESRQRVIYDAFNKQEVAI